MDLIFNYVGYAFGFVLWLFYSIVRNYGVAIIFFTIVLKLVLLPFSIKQQKSMAKNASLSAKQQELRKKYANDKNKLNEELTALYQKEGTSPMGGCLTMILPLLLMLGVFYVVRNPLTNALHISSGEITAAMTTLKQLPGVGINFGSNYYGEIDIIKHCQELKLLVPNMFSSGDWANIEFYNQGFNIFGLNLLDTANQCEFTSFVWIIPALCLVSSLVTQFITQRLTGQATQQQGCMKVTLYLMPLISAYFAYVVPAAVGFYWVISTLLSLLQTVVLNKFCSAGILQAKAEAQRVLLREQQERKIERL